MIRLRQAGDTIVEVLIALGVTSLLLGGAYSTTIRSLNGSRQSQERVEALKHAESQAEVLRSSATAIGFAVGSPTSFCLNTSTGAVVPLTGAVGPITAENFTIYPAGCQAGTSVKYYLSITRALATDHSFVIRARWDRAGGDGKEEVPLNYAVY